MNCLPTAALRDLDREASRAQYRSNAMIVAFARPAEGTLSETSQSGPEPGSEPVAETVDHSRLIVRIAADRDRKAFVTLYEYFAPRVKSYLVGQRVPADVADELLQEVMLAVWNKAGQFNPDKAAASTWIFAIARNKRIDRIRKDTKPDLDPEEPSLLPGGFEAADESLLDKQRKAAVGAALAELPDDQRNVIELSFMKGLSHSEIAERLGLPLGTVKSRIRLAFQRLRGELGEVL